MEVSLPAKLKEIMLSQLENMGRRRNWKRYTPLVYEICMLLFHYSRSCYAALRVIFMNHGNHLCECLNLAPPRACECLNLAPPSERSSTRVMPSACYCSLFEHAIKFTTHQRARPPASAHMGCALKLERLRTELSGVQATRPRWVGVHFSLIWYSVGFNY